MSTHFYYDGRRKYYTKDEWYELIGHWQFKEEVEKLFKEFVTGASGFTDCTPQEVLDAYYHEVTDGETIEVENVIDDGLPDLRDCYSIYSFDTMITKLKQYSLVHKAFALLLDQWTARVEQLKSEVPQEKHRPELGVGPIEDPALMGN